jgi:predicted patatin/cPLA2 family phospholipase
MAAELEAAGLTDAIDLVVGTSSGGIAGAMFVAGDAALAERAYHEHLNTKHFVDLRRVLSRRPVVALDHLFATADALGVDFTRTIHAPAQLHLTAFSLEQQRTVTLSDFGTVDELVLAMRASCSIPVFAGPPTVIDGDRLVDGSVLDPIPCRVAIGLGATDVVALTTRPAGTAHSKRGPVEWFVVDPLLRRLDPRLARLERQRPVRCNSQLEELRVLGAHPGVCVLAIDGAAPTIDNLETDAGRLRAGAEAGRAAVRAALRSG